MESFHVIFICKLVRTRICNKWTCFSKRTKIKFLSEDILKLFALAIFAYTAEVSFIILSSSVWGSLSISKGSSWGRTVEVSTNSNSAIWVLALSNSAVDIGIHCSGNWHLRQREALTKASAHSCNFWVNSTALPTCINTFCFPVRHSSCKSCNFRFISTQFVDYQPMKPSKSQSPSSSTLSRILLIFESALGVRSLWGEKDATGRLG